MVSIGGGVTNNLWARFGCHFLCQPPVVSTSLPAPAGFAGSDSHLTHTLSNGHLQAGLHSHTSGPRPVVSATMDCGPL